MKKLTTQGPAAQPQPQPGHGKGLLAGILYGLAPHTFCILFIVLSVVGATAATSVIKGFLTVPYLFQIIVALSLVFATVSAVLYLRRNGILSMRGARFKCKYLSIMYGTTVGINLLFFLVVFPLLANVDYSRGPALAAGAPQSAAVAASQRTLALQVSIPCSGHAPLIMDELKKAAGITGVKYALPNNFRVTFDSSQTSEAQILGLAIFKEFPATVRQ